MYLYTIILSPRRPPAKLFSSKRYEDRGAVRLAEPGNHMPAPVTRILRVGAQVQLLQMIERGIVRDARIVAVHLKLGNMQINSPGTVTFSTLSGRPSKLLTLVPKQEFTFPSSPPFTGNP